jgi:hypothetical protein
MLINHLKKSPSLGIMTAFIVCGTPVYLLMAYS